MSCLCDRAQILNRYNASLAPAPEQMQYVFGSRSWLHLKSCKNLELFGRKKKDDKIYKGWNNNKNTSKSPVFLPYFSDSRDKSPVYWHGDPTHAWHTAAPFGSRWSSKSPSTQAILLFYGKALFKIHPQKPHSSVLWAACQASSSGCICMKVQQSSGQHPRRRMAMLLHHGVTQRPPSTGWV